MRAVLAHMDAAASAAAGSALRGAGWDVVHARDSDEVLAACAAGDVDVAFLDAGLRERSPGLVSELKRRPETFATSVVIVATEEQVGVADALDALGAGAHDLLIRPFGAAEVVARAAAAARSRALVEELLERDRRIEDLVFVDELTGLYNRRYLLHQMAMMIAAARRHGHELGAVLLDVDHFKEINDTYGHPAGDDVLRSIAEAIAARLRTEDVAGRLGGDEFLVLLPETDPEGVATVADEIRRQVAATGVRAGGRHIRATVSVGAASWRGEERDDLLGLVDRALYDAKDGGRDRIAAR